MQPGDVRDTVEKVWEADILPALTEYIAIPAVSVLYDPDWPAHGHVADAVRLISTWCAARPVEGLTMWVHELPGRTPVVVCEIDAFGGGGGGPTSDDAVLLYGHLDKQPPMDGWHDGLGPWSPVRRGDLLYGRGGADDGYSAFAALAALEAVQRAGGRHSRCVLVVEASEESGSPDLPDHVDALSKTIGSPSLAHDLFPRCRQVWD